MKEIEIDTGDFKVTIGLSIIANKQTMTVRISRIIEEIKEYILEIKVTNMKDLLVNLLFFYEDNFFTKDNLYSKLIQLPNWKSDIGKDREKLSNSAKEIFNLQSTLITYKVNFGINGYIILNNKDKPKEKYYISEINEKGWNILLKEFKGLDIWPHIHQSGYDKFLPIE
jgi:hypothetical protein